MQRKFPLAKKKSNEEAIRRGIEQLRQSGLAIDDTSPALIPRLREQLEKGKDTVLAVVFALGKISDAAALETLRAIERGATDKEVKREVKRSFFKLAQRGLAVPKDGPA